MCVIVLYSIVLYCTVLYGPVLHCITMPTVINPLAVQQQQQQQKQWRWRRQQQQQFPHKAQGHASTVTGQQQAPHLLLNTVTHSLPSVTHTTWGGRKNWSKERCDEGYSNCLCHLHCDDIRIICLEELSYTVCLDIQVANANCFTLWQNYTCMLRQWTPSEIHNL